MRVLRIAHASLTPRLRERERALARCYPDVQLEVVTTERWREAEVDVEATDDDLFPVRKARSHFSRHIQLFAYDPRPIIGALRQFQPDVIDLNAEPYSVQCAEVLTLRNWFAPRVPVVMGTSQNIFHRYPPPFNLLERRGLKQVSAAYGCSESVRELLIAKGFRRTIRVIPFGVNLTEYNFRDRLVRESKTLTIGFVGRMLPGKGLNILAKALERISSDDWKLLAVGNGPEREPFTQRLKELNLIQRAQFTGAVSYEKMPPYFQEIDLLVVPTQTTARIREQFGRVIVEAMASGVPVIGSTCGAIPEVMGDAGVVFPEGDAEALATAIQRLLTGEDLRRGLARAGRERVEQHYSWERVASQMYELFHEVLRPAVGTEMTQSVEATA
ncbi:MAG TPA: glycosyltransferase family 4 protein [Pyrinomonadaceae bacterium]